jgi:Spy/CpxP family protein refolding chaperone
MQSNSLLRRRWFGRAVRGIAACSTLVLLACATPDADDASSATPSPPDAARAAGEEREGREVRRKGRGHGPHMMFEAALGLSDLSAAQRATIEGLEADLAPSSGDFAPMKAYHEALVEQVRSGAIDASKLESHLDAMAAAMKAKRGELATALEKLHTTLSSEQRSALISELETRAPQHRGKRHEEGDDGERHDKKRFGRRGRGGGPAAWLLRDLDLSAEQREKIKAATEGLRGERPDKAAMNERHEAMRAKVKAFADAFASDSFDADALLADGDKDAHMRSRLDAKTKLLEAVVPILDDSQRQELASRMERGPHGGKGRGHRDKAPE